MKKPLIIILICVILACAVVLFLLFGFNYAGDSGQQTQADGSAESGSTEADDFAGYETVDLEEIFSSDTADSYYQYIVNVLQEQRKAGWADSYPENYGLSGIFAGQDLTCCYVIEDLDQDGVNELYLGAADGDSMKIYQIFTAPDGQANTLYRSFSTDDYLTLTEQDVFLTAAAVQEVSDTEADSEAELIEVDPASLDEDEISYIEMNYHVKYVDGSFVPDEEEESDSDSETTPAAEEEEQLTTGAYILADGAFVNTDLPETVTAEKMKTVLIDE